MCVLQKRDEMSTSTTRQSPRALPFLSYENTIGSLRYGFGGGVSDCLSVGIADGTVESCLEVNERVTFELSATGQVLGVKIRDVAGFIDPDQFDDEDDDDE